jgi:hypothetical protein
MIICPNCKEEIEDDSHYCDQCGQALLYCKNCGRVGIGRRCTQCGGIMIMPEEFQRMNERTGYSSLMSASMSQGMLTSNSIGNNSYGSMPMTQRPAAQGIPVLTLYNTSLNIHIQGINGAVIGRRQGPYTQYFSQHMYVSGVHAQLKYNAGSGWCVVDKHSSNGTKLNQHALQPDVEMALRNGDILTIANLNLQVSVS